LGEIRIAEEVNGGEDFLKLENTDLDIRDFHIHGGMKHNLAGYAKYYFCGSNKS
jgi:hypothetical protein